jgi:hypothetical protein
MLVSDFLLLCTTFALWYIDTPFLLILGLFVDMVLKDVIE